MISPPPPPPMPPRRKKWTEEEERTLIDKYGELLTNGTLSKMKTREKKFRPIAAQVNSLHHHCDPISFPWQWSWKDVSTKVQNMRHQYLLVKQKIKKPISTTIDDDGIQNAELDDHLFDWAEGGNHWPNFLRYKNVFGDLPLLGLSDTSNLGPGRDVVRFDHVQDDGFGVVGVALDDCDNGVLGLGLRFDLDGDDEEENITHTHSNHNHSINTNTIHNNSVNDNGIHHIQENGDNANNGDDVIEYDEVFPSSSNSRKKRKKLKGIEKQKWVHFANQFTQLREREARFEEQEVERERERQRMEVERKRRYEKQEKEREDREMRRRERMREWEMMEKECVERERRKKEEELIMEREWEKRMEQRRMNWSKRINDMLSQHRAEMDQIQSRILHDQQSLTNQLVGILSQWTGHPTGLSDHTGAGNPYLSQMIQNLHHVNGIVHSENRVEEDNQDDQFIVDDG